MNNVLGIFFQILNFYDQQFYKVNLGNGDILFRGVLSIENGRGHGGGRGQKTGKSGDILYGWSLCLIFCLFLFTSNLFTSHTLSTKAILISNITMHISRGMVLLLVLKAHFLTQACKSAVPFLQNPWDYRDSTNFFLTVGQNNFGNKILILAGILKTLCLFFHEDLTISKRNQYR